MQSLGVGRIYKSKNPKFKEGQIVYGALDWAEYTLLKEYSSQQIQVLQNKYNIPWSSFTGVLGMPGFTAYRYAYIVRELISSGLKHIGHPKKGETIFISAASGAVGQLVGQLAKQDGSPYSCDADGRSSCCW